MFPSKKRRWRYNLVVIVLLICMGISFLVGVTVGIYLLPVLDIISKKNHHHHPIYSAALEETKEMLSPERKVTIEKILTAQTITTVKGTAQITTNQATTTNTTTTQTTRTTTTRATKSSSSSNLHLIFSTTCSPSQDWQSYVFFYFAHHVKQLGTITRIVSGCDPNQLQTLQQFHNRTISSLSDRYQLHVAPASPDRRSKYFNKPYGVLHFMEHVLGYNNTKNSTIGPFKKTNTIHQMEEEHDDTIVILLDPDMMLLRPFLPTYVHPNTTISDSSSSSYQLLVRHGHPMAQRYGYAVSWYTTLIANLTYLLNDTMENTTTKTWRINNNKYGNSTTTTTSLSRFLKSLSYEDMETKYPAGPPYVMTGHDMYRLVLRWTDMLSRVHTVFPSMMSEMYAYSWAAIIEDLPHQLVTNFMISDVDCDDLEEWNFLTQAQYYKRETICRRDDKSQNMDLEHLNKDHTTNSTTTTTTKRAIRNSSSFALPYIFHYCQSYALGPWLWQKRHIPPTILECSAPLIMEPPQDVAVRYDWFVLPKRNKSFVNLTKKKPFRILQHGWAMCRMIHSLNDALIYFKSNHCPSKDEGSSGSTTSGMTRNMTTMTKSANWNKSLIFHPPDEFESLQRNGEFSNKVV